MIGVSNLQGFCTCDFVLWKVHVHLVPIEVSIVCVAVCIVHADCFLPGQDSCSMTHDGWFMEGWLSIHQHYISICKMPMDLLIACSIRVSARRSQKLIRQTL